MKNNSPQDWPEPIVRVQSLSERCTDSIPERYIKPLSDRPSDDAVAVDDANIPIIDLAGLYGLNILGNSISYVLYTKRQDIQLYN